MAGCELGVTGTVVLGILLMVVAIPTLMWLVWRLFGDHGLSR